MPIDPYLARGITPLGAGLADTAELMSQMKYRTAAAEEARRRTDIDQQREDRFGQVLTQAQQATRSEQELRAKYAEMVGLSSAPPQYQAKYIELQRQEHPEFAQTPFAQMEPSAAFKAMRDSLAAQLGEKPEEAEGGIKIGQYNPGDYTPESWARFLQTSDPGGLQRQYAPPAPPNQTIVQMPQGQAIFNPRTGQMELVSTREAQRAAEAADAAATKTAELGTERAYDLPQAKARLAATESKMDRMVATAQSILDDDGLWKAVGLGQGLAMIPSSEGARVKAKIKNLQSQAGLAVLQDMRDNSKTGGAVGNVSNYEQQILQNNLAALDQTNVSPEDYRKSVQQIVDYGKGTKARFRDAFKYTYPEIDQAPPARPGQSGTPEDPLGIRK